MYKANYAGQSPPKPCIGLDLGWYTVPNDLGCYTVPNDLGCYTVPNDLGCYTVPNDLDATRYQMI